MPGLKSTGIYTLANEFNTAPITAGNDVLATALVCPKAVCVFRITIVVATSSVVNITEINSTPTTNTYGLNESSALNAGDLYTFTFGVRDDYTYKKYI